MASAGLGYRVKAPDKGSFPLDRQKLCNQEADVYRQCILSAKGTAKKCKDEAAEYLKCRMDKGLMQKQDLETLGFVEETSWNYEKMSQQELMKKVKEIEQQSAMRVWKEYQGQQQQNPQQQQPQQQQQQQPSKPKQ